MPQWITLTRRLVWENKKCLDFFWKDIKDIQAVRGLVQANIKNNQQILKNIEKSILSIEFTQQYLAKYLEDGFLSKSDLLEFYQRDDIRAKFKALSNEIELISD